MKIKLTHSSSHPGAEGNPGDEIECDDEIAQRFIDGNGAVALEPEPVAETPEPPKPTRKTKTSR